jgi:alpha-tubulin suppressor-like RCC1 family protein
MIQNIYSFSFVVTFVLFLILAEVIFAGGGPSRIPVTRSVANTSTIVDYNLQNISSAGRNDFGQLGNGSTSSNPVGNLQIVLGLSTTYSPVPGAEHGIAFQSGTTVLFVWGSNLYGQLGRSENAGTLIPHPTPIPITLPGNKIVSRVVVGRYCSFALDNEGKLWSWGYNKYGELGHSQGIGTENPNFTPTEVVTVDSVIKWHSIYPSGAHHIIVFGLMPSGQTRAYSFGRNNMGQLGRTDNVGTDIPNPIPKLVNVDKSASFAIAGTDFTLMLAAASTELYSFGSNQFGQLGRNENSGTTNPTPTPAIVQLPSGITAWSSVVAGGVHALGLGYESGNAKLFSWGSNEFGQLGYPTNSGTTIPNPAPKLIPLINSEVWISLAAGENHSMVTTGDYAAPNFWACGLNNWGQLANPANIGTMTPTPEWVVFGTPVSDVEPETELPLEYSLEQNYPNPFNPTTTIAFQIPERGFVSLKVFDIAGNEIVTLVDGELEAGRHEVKFNAGKLSSAVYIYKLETARYKSSKKLVLMK